MAIKPRTIIIFAFLLLAVYAVVKVVSFFWLVVFFNVLLIYINAVFLFAYFEMKPPGSMQHGKLPSVSIVIPNYNGAQTIVQCIESVKGLGYPSKKEIIVVDDGSNDSSGGLREKMSGIKVIFKRKNEGKAAALNDGIRAAAGELIATIDSDTYPEPDSLVKMVAQFTSADIGAVTGFVRAANARGYIEKIQEVEYLISFGFFQSVLSDINAVFVTPGPMSLFKAGVLKEIGGVDEKNITEDMEIALRLRRHGYRIVTCLEAHIYTQVPSTMKHLFRQRVRWYRGKFFNTVKYRDMLFNPRFGEFGLFTFPFSVMLEWCIVLFVFVFIAGNIESLANFAGLFAAWSSVGGNVSALIPVTLSVSPSIYFYLFGVCFYSVFVYISHNLAGDKISIGKLPEIALFILAYGLFILIVFFVGFYREINSSDYAW